MSIDIGAVEDARRLAVKVTQQHEQLTAQAAHIADLETRLYWYRQAFGVEPPVPPDRDDEAYASDGNSETEDFVEIDPSGEPAAAPPASETASRTAERAEEIAQSSEHGFSQADDGGSVRTTRNADDDSESSGSADAGIDCDSTDGSSSSISLWVGRLRRFIR